eukprot:GHVS01059651.1.p1 GENE.GHVS01059651.1~~GHVS01059651.1.p1  ORF type:complete len:219 (-),score=18.09 GHVS01059651.1:54-710(-)
MEKLFPEDVQQKGLLIYENNQYWNSVLSFRQIFGDELEVHCGNLDIDTRTFANIYSIRYFAREIICIEPASRFHHYTMTRIITAVVERLDDKVEVHHHVVGSVELREFEAPDSQLQNEFWTSLGYFYVEALNKAWDDPEMRDPTNPAFTDAISKKGIFDYEVDGLSVNTVLTKVEKVEDADDPNKDLIRIHATSTLKKLHGSEIQLLHTRLIILPLKE